MLVVCSNPFFYKSISPKCFAHTGFSDNCDVFM